MHFSLETRTVSLSVGEFAGFSLGPSDSGGGPQGIWRAQLGQHWHNELQKRTLAEAAAAQFEVAIDGRITHRGWTFALNGRIDQLVGDTLREIKSVMRPLPAEETELRTDYPSYFLQLAAYAVLVRASSLNSQLSALNRSALRAELIFVEAGSGLARALWRPNAATFEPLAERWVDRGCRILARGRVVVTDRLHGHLLSVLQGIPHVVLDNSYGKLSRFIGAWSHGSALVKLASSPDEAHAMARTMPGGVTSSRSRRRGVTRNWPPSRRAENAPAVLINRRCS